MLIALAILALLSLPVFLVVAVTLGPLVLGMLCAIVFGLVVAAAANLLGLGVSGGGLERDGSRLVHRH